MEPEIKLLQAYFDTMGIPHNTFNIQKYDDLPSPLKSTVQILCNQWEVTDNPEEGPLPEDDEEASFIIHLFKDNSLIPQYNKTKDTTQRYRVVDHTFRSDFSGGEDWSLPFFGLPRSERIEALSEIYKAYKEDFDTITGEVKEAELDEIHIAHRSGRDFGSNEATTIFQNPYSYIRNYRLFNVWQAAFLAERLKITITK